MGIEKPISTIRKAVQRMAEEEAEKESLNKPEQRHYDDVFTTYKVLRMLDPERLELNLKVTAKQQELKNGIGTELFKVFDKVWIEATKEGKKEIAEAVDQLERTLNISPKEFNRKLKEIDEQYLKEKAILVKSDPRIISDFKGKEELLDRAIKTTISSMNELMQYNREHPSRLG